MFMITRIPAADMKIVGSLKIYTFKSDNSSVVSDGGTWLPGSYDSPETAEKAASLLNEELSELEQKVNKIQSRLITMQDMKPYFDKV